MEFGQVIEEVGDDTYYLNMGPQHPSMHGVLRLLLKLKGELILTCEPIIGYAHRAQEKMAENRSWLQFLPQTSRLDYLSGMIYNVGYCQAVEKMVGIEVPERAEYIRVIACELNRIQSHLLWWGAFLLDIGAWTPLLYFLDEREHILEILDRVSGSRLTYAYARFGGVCQDVDDKFCEMTAAFLKRFRGNMPDYLTLVRENVIFQKRTQGVGYISAETALKYGMTGPCLRASGVEYDVRRAEPYGIYDRFDFEIPTRTEGDSFARFDVRIDELEQSCRIIEQALSGLPDGPFKPKRVPKKLKPKPGDYYFAVESGRGQFGMYFVSDGGEVPAKLKLRTPSFSNLSAMAEVLAGTMVADTIAILGSIDLILPEIDR